MASKRNITGENFGEWLVLQQAPPKADGRSCWLCRCSCGVKVIVRERTLVSGTSTKCMSCAGTQSGLKRNYPRLSNYREHAVWSAIKQRCFNSRDRAYKWYGGRGITMSAEWRDSFATFIRDMGRCPPGFTIDRYPDQNGNYESGNCRWTDWKSQQRNRRNNVLLTYQGKTQSVIAWSEETRLKYTTILGRINIQGWSVADALSKPARYMPKWRAKIQSRKLSQSD